MLGTDVTPSTEIPKRPPILLLPVDGDGEGPVLDVAGEDFEDNDVTDPMRMWDFRVSLDSIDAADPNRARVTVHFVSAHRPQLQLRPAPGGTNFKSPDITLRNPSARSSSSRARPTPSGSPSTTRERSPRPTWPPTCNGCRSRPRRARGTRCPTRRGSPSSRRRAR
ncbi:hypothetical protein GCM10010932_11480 [Agromyces flavus]|nr:hypothetical protein GCM10010932_11480 [Agromyces flavus]